jgi:hypothetical protein
VWGQVEKLGKGTKANFDPDKKIIFALIEAHKCQASF